MKILMVNTVSFGTNGITSVIMNIYKAINKKDMQIDFVTITEPLNEYKSEFAENNSRYYILKRREGTIKYFFNLIKLMKKEKYDILHVHGNSANIALELLAGRLGRIKVRIAHSHNTASPHPIIHKILYPICSALVTTRIACGDEAGKWLFRDKDYIVLKNGINLEKFRFDNTQRIIKRKELGIEDELVIGHIGTYWEQKNHSFIIQVFCKIVKKHPKSVLLLIGDGPEFEEIERLVKLKGIADKVIFVKQTLEVEKYMMAMDVFILPSIFEGFPVVSVEAQASGLPCIFSECVTTATNMTGLIQFISLNEEEKWVEAICNIGPQRRDSEESIGVLTENGFNIKSNAELLRNLFYTELKKQKS